MPRNKRTHAIGFGLLLAFLLFALPPNCVATAYAATDITAAFTDPNFKAAVYLAIGKTAPKPILNTDVSAISTLNVANKNIMSLDGLQHFTTLTTLDCSGNELESLDLSANLYLTTLVCNNSQLTELDVSKNTLLTGIYASFNYLTTLDVSKNVNLNTLDCAFNQLSTLDISKNTKLTTLDCAVNELTMLDISKNTMLTTLDCSQNQLKSLNPSTNDKLTWLDASQNQLKTLNVSRNASLSTFYCSVNQLRELNVSTNAKLSWLDCSQNRLTSLALNASAPYTYLNAIHNHMASESAITGQTILWDGSTFIFNPQHKSGFHAVANIVNVPQMATAGTTIPLNATIIPSDATHKTILWKIVEDLDNTGSTIRGNGFHAKSEGIVAISATIKNGISATEDFEKTFVIIVINGKL